jgi:hypothetical protein
VYKCGGSRDGNVWGSCIIVWDCYAGSKMVHISRENATVKPFYNYFPTVLTVATNGLHPVHCGNHTLQFSNSLHTARTHCSRTVFYCLHSSTAHRVPIPTIHTIENRPPPEGQYTAKPQNYAIVVKWCFTVADRFFETVGCTFQARLP